MPRPDPPVVFRQHLAASKRAGIPFKEAWDAAFHQTLFPNETRVRHEWYAAMRGTRWAYKVSYEDAGEIPGGAALVALAEELSETDSTTTAPGVHAVSNTGRVAA